MTSSYKATFANKFIGLHGYHLGFFLIYKLMVYKKITESRYKSEMGKNI